MIIDLINTETPNFLSEDTFYAILLNNIPTFVAFSHGKRYSSRELETPKSALIENENN
jgi:hypothetical protein